MSSNGAGGGSDPHGAGNGASHSPSGEPAPQRSWLGSREAGPRMALVGLVALLTAGFVMHLQWLLSKPNLADAMQQAGGWVHLLEADGFSAALLVIGPSLMLVALVLGLLVHFGMPRVWQSAQGPLQLGALLGSCLAAAWFVAPPSSRASSSKIGCSSSLSCRRRFSPSRRSSAGASARAASGTFVSEFPRSCAQRSWRAKTSAVSTRSTRSSSGSSAV